MQFTKKKLLPGQLIVEATAGNTGLGLALIANMLGHPLTLVIPDKMSKAKIDHLLAMGTNIVMTRSDVEKGHPEYYQDLAKKIAKKENGFFVDQFSNMANPLAHETSTGPEIWQQMNHKIDAIVVGVGSAGTLTGLTNFFKKISRDVDIIVADPVGSIIKEYIELGKIVSKPGSWLVEGVGEDFIPDNADFSLVKEGIQIDDKESFLTARKLLKNEGILAGSSSGTLIAAAMRYCQKQSTPKRVVTFVCDSGNKYLDKMFNNQWMKEKGLL